MPLNSRDHAIVIGASMGGLLAARVLSDYYQRVTLIEKDHFPSPGGHRRGVPQSRHTHGLLAAGYRTLETLFLGIGQDIMDAGGVPGDVVETGRWFHEGGYLRQVKSGLDGALLSRPLLESIVRRRALANDKISVMEGVEVSGLKQASKGVVAGLELQDGRELSADLIVESCGRASKGIEWLEALEYAAPKVEKVEIALAYTTRIFRREPSHLGGNLAAIIPPTPEGKRGGVILAQENSTWTVTLLSYFGQPAPSDLAGFREFAATLPAPDIAEVLCLAQPIGDAQGMRFPASIRKRYEHLDRFPEGYLAFGDSICSFNPIYGQGMSSAALQALALGEALKADRHNLAKRFFAQAAKVVDIPWSIAVGNDLRMPETIGPRNAGVNFVNWYIAKLHKAAHKDAELTVAFLKVANLLAPPPSVMHPRLAWRVLMGNLFSHADPEASRPPIPA